MWTPIHGRCPPLPPAPPGSSMGLNLGTSFRSSFLLEIWGMIITHLGFLNSYSSEKRVTERRPVGQKYVSFINDKAGMATVA